MNININKENLIDFKCFRNVYNHDKKLYDSFGTHTYWKFSGRSGFAESKETNDFLFKFIDYWISDIEGMFDIKPFIKNVEFEKNVELSFEVTKRMFKTFFPDMEVPDKPLAVDYYNAEDYYFQSPYAYPDIADSKNLNILDFGPGYGRNLNIYSKTNKELCYCAVDAIESSYIVQNSYFSLFDLNFYEYFVNPEIFKINDQSGIYHLPSWRIDLLPSNFFDKIICTNVLPELHPKFALHLFQVFNRILKPRGSLYIRDHIHRFLRDDISLEDELIKNGFILEFRPVLKDQVEIWGLPSIWRKVTDEISNDYKKRSLLDRISLEKMFKLSSYVKLFQFIQKRFKNMR
jgi:SAM-dependent methyltransferase